MELWFHSRQLSNRRTNSSAQPPRSKKLSCWRRSFPVWMSDRFLSSRSISCDRCEWTLAPKKTTKDCWYSQLILQAWRPGSNDKTTTRPFLAPTLHWVYRNLYNVKDGFTILIFPAKQEFFEDSLQQSENHKNNAETDESVVVTLLSTSHTAFHPRTATWPIRIFISYFQYRTCVRNMSGGKQ